MVFNTNSREPLVDDYESIFARRGREYNRGMQTWPLARAREFSTALGALKPQKGETLLDAPAGGGYTNGFLSPELDLRLIEIDPAIEFRRDQHDTPVAAGNADSCDALIASLDAIPLSAGCCDGIVSIAGLHHASDLNAVFTEFHRVLRPAGRLVILEVEAGSKVDRFLNGFVDKHNSSGHSGSFVDEKFRRCLGESGFVVARDSKQSYTWDFPDKRAMAEFTRLVFGLDRADEETILEGINHVLGSREVEGSCLMNWELQLITCHPDARS